MLTLPDFNQKKIVVVFTQEGDKISFQNDNILIKDINNKIKYQYTCYKIFIIMIVGGFTITSGLIERANRFGFSIVFMTHSLRVYLTINSKMEGNTLLREKQYNNIESDLIAKRIVINKIKNQKEQLLKIREKDDELKDTLKLLNNYMIKLENENLKIDEIMGIEGIAAKIYFEKMYNEFNWRGRQPRVKRDEINLLLDIGYTILFNYIEAIVNIYGFDIYKGVLHREFFKRKSLICDFIEPFRPIIDYKIRKIYKLSQINKEDFLIDNGRYSLNWKSNLKYMSLFAEEIISYKYSIFNFVQSYYRWFMKDKNLESFPDVILKER